MQLVVASNEPLRAFVITRRTQKPAVLGLASASQAAHGGAWGVSRVLRLEYPAVQLVHRDLAHLRTFEAALLLSNDPSRELELTSSSTSPTHCARLRSRNENGPVPGRCACVGGGFILTGGLGGLGLQAATLLSEGGAARLLCTSRSGQVAHAGQALDHKLHQLRSSGTNLDILASDVSDPCDSRAVSLFALDALSGPCSGFFHLAAGFGGTLLATMRPGAPNARHAHTYRAHPAHTARLGVPTTTCAPRAHHAHTTCTPHAHRMHMHTTRTPRAHHAHTTRTPRAPKQHHAHHTPPRTTTRHHTRHRTPPRATTYHRTSSLSRPPAVMLHHAAHHEPHCNVSQVITLVPPSDDALYS